jgi:hypothetical protein
LLILVYLAVIYGVVYLAASRAFRKNMTRVDRATGRMSAEGSGEADGEQLKE